MDMIRLRQEGDEHAVLVGREHRAEIALVQEHRVPFDPQDALSPFPEKTCGPQKIKADQAVDHVVRGGFDPTGFDPGYYSPGHEHQPTHPKDEAGQRPGVHNPIELGPILGAHNIVRLFVNTYFKEN
jgi:hypothetical protein